MCARLKYPAVFQDIDPISPPDGIQTMGDNEDRTLSEKVLDGLLDEELTFGVKCGGGLIENHDSRIFKDSPGYGNPLPLPS